MSLSQITTDGYLAIYMAVCLFLMVRPEQRLKQLEK
ncbi:MAG: hypothetical protein RL757_2796 [Bacteroidota bacterium]